jgi:hypothetical protein
MQTRVLWVPVVIAGVLTAGLWTSPRLAPAQNAPVDAGRHSQEVGAPQVLEIPVRSSLTQPTAPVGTPASDQLSGFGDVQPHQDWSSSATGGPFSEWPDPSVAESKRTYLGVLYATAEEGPEGVQVLSVIEGSPAHRSGFEGVNTPTQYSRNDLVKKAAIIALAMSPAGPFVLPLVAAHDHLTRERRPAGDLIVAVETTPVRTAQDFTETMQRYHPGDQVSFSVLRKNQPRQITVTLEEEPLEP